MISPIMFLTELESMTGLSASTFNDLSGTDWVYSLLKKHYHLTGIQPDNYDDFIALLYVNRFHPVNFKRLNGSVNTHTGDVVCFTDGQYQRVGLYSDHDYVLYSDLVTNLYTPIFIRALDVGTVWKQPSH